jgi:hypothetical protein
VTHLLPYIGESLILTLDKKDQYEYLKNMNILLPDFAKNNGTYLKLWESNLINQLLSECAQCLDKALQARSKQLHFVSLIKNIWLHYYAKFNM